MKRIFLVLSFVLLFISCKTFDTALLQPSTDSINPKLRHLSFAESGNVLAVKEANTLDSNSYMYTYFKREISNFVETRGESKGKLEITITYAKADVHLGWAVLSGLTLLIPNLFGMPIQSMKAQLEFEVTIKDLKDNVVWNRIYYGKKPKAYGLYNSYADFETAKSVLFMEIFKSQITTLKANLQADADTINESLDSQN